MVCVTVKETLHIHTVLVLDSR